MSSEIDPAPAPLCPSIAPSWAGNVILTPPWRSNLAELSWLARWVAALRAPGNAGVQGARDGGTQPGADHHGLVQGNAQTPGALDVDRGVGLRLSEIPRGDHGVDQPEDPRLFEGVGQLSITRSHRV